MRARIRLRGTAWDRSWAGGLTSAPLARLLLLPALLLPVLLLSCSAKDRPSAHKRQDGPCIVLDKAFQPLRTDFESEGGMVRLVAILAPSCGECGQTVKAVQDKVLSTVNSEDFMVLLIWTSIMPADVLPHAEMAAQMVQDPRVVNYWDDSGRIARAFAGRLGLEPGRSVTDVYFLYGRNDTWDPDMTMAQELPDQNALLAGWRPSEPRYMMGETPAAKLPGFDANRLVQQVEELLAEPASAAGQR